LVGEKMEKNEFLKLANKLRRFDIDAEYNGEFIELEERFEEDGKYVKFEELNEFLKIDEIIGR